MAEAITTVKTKKLKFCQHQTESSSSLPGHLLFVPLLLSLSPERGRLLLLSISQRICPSEAGLTLYVLNR